MQNSKQNGMMRWGRAAISILLLVLLAVSGYAGTTQKSVCAVSVPVTYQTISAWEVSVETMQEVQERLRQERMQEMELLDSVIVQAGGSGETAEHALAQKAQLAGRMETESRVRAALAYMGYTQVNVVCGAGSLTLIAPWQYVSGEQERVKLIAAAADQAQIPAECVKIILPKNE